MPVLNDRPLENAELVLNHNALGQAAVPSRPSDGAFRAYVPKAWVQWGDEVKGLKRDAERELRVTTCTTHHIVPANQLRELDEKCATRRELRVALNQFLVDACGVVLPLCAGGFIGSSDLNALVGYLNDLDRQGSASKEAELPQNVGCVLYSIPGNLFMGPDRNLRDDDPDEAFERQSWNVTGSQYFQEMLKINETLLQFVSTGDKDTLIRLLRCFRRILRRDVPWRCRSEDWAQRRASDGQMKFVLAAR